MSAYDDGSGGFFRAYHFPKRGQSAKKDKGSGDSIWGKIVSWGKNLNMTPREILYDISYENLIMYSAATPQYDDEREPEWDATKDASNPDNFVEQGDEEVYVR